MKLSRRDFLILTTGFVAGCSSTSGGGNSGAGRERVIDVGAAGNYAVDGISSRFHDQGFFIVRNGEKLFALSVYCTHRKCKLNTEAGRSFRCPCHGSTFDANGQVTKGPARLDLPQFPVTINEAGRLLVTAPAL